MKLNIAVIFGSRTCEHDVSIISGMQAAGGLNQNDYSVERVYISRDGSWYVGEALKDMKFYQNPDFSKVTRVIPAAGDLLIDPVSGIWQYKRHIEAVRSESQYPSVSEYQRLQEQRDRNGDTGGIRSEEECDQRTSYRMSCRSADQRYIEHHGQKGKSSAYAEHRKLLFWKFGFYFFDRMDPYRDHGSCHDTAADR